MLQKYDKLLATTALAVAALAGSAMADAAGDLPACDLSDGYASSAAGFSAQLESCLADESTTVHRGDVEANVLALTQRYRSRLGIDQLQTRASLDQAAQAHALDMAARSYAAHEDLEGRSHLHRVRTLDRSVLIGSAGANIAAGELGAGPDAFGALTADPVNRANLSRDAFSHVGIGAAEAVNGTVYVVQLFAQIDGELDAPLPASFSSTADLDASFVDTGFEHVGWSLTDETGRLLDRGYGERVTATLGAAQSAFINIDVARHGGDTYSLKGPRITGQ
ncbi:MAG: CAP domain-containing protein [Pseudomonadota bacterium]